MTPTEREAVLAAVVSVAHVVVSRIAAAGAHPLATEDPEAAASKIAQGYAKFSDCWLLKCYRLMLDSGYFPPEHTPIVVTED